MNIKVACGLTAATLSLLLGTQAYAQNDLKAEAMPISLAGCIQRETEYRQQHNAGKGGFLGFGGGLGDEYVLVNASRGADGAFGGCATATGGDAYELTGSAEDDFEPFVGQRVAITGTRKEAQIDVETGRPAGGRQAGDDLRLFEVEGVVPPPGRASTDRYRRARATAAGHRRHRPQSSARRAPTRMIRCHAPRARLR